MISRKNPILRIASSGYEQKDIVLGKSFYSVGRGEKQAIQIAHPTVSRWHCTLFRALNIQPYTIADGNAEIIDFESGKEIKSLTGTWVNNHQIKSSYILNHGDRLKLGAVELIYLEKGETEPDPFDTLEESKNL